MAATISSWTTAGTNKHGVAHGTGSDKINPSTMRGFVGTYVTDIDGDGTDATVLSLLEHNLVPGDEITIDANHDDYDGKFAVSATTGFTGATPQKFQFKSSSSQVNKTGTVTHSLKGFRSYPRHECHIWIDGTSAITTDSFNWPIRGNFKINLNVMKLDIGSIGTCTAKIEGSVDKSNWFAMGSNLGTTSLDDAFVSYLYNADTNGVAPYMRLSITPETDVGNPSSGLKIIIDEIN